MNAAAIAEALPSSRNFWIFLALTVGVFLPRFLALGWFPEMDEGYYAMVTQYVGFKLSATGEFPADVGGYQLYPLLLTGLSCLPGNIILWMRLADLGFALLAAVFMCLVFMRESKSAVFGGLLATICLLGLNHPVAIDNGMKNSFFPAFACFFVALYITASAPTRGWGWVFAGLLTGVGVLLRETFAPFAFLGVAALLVKKNWQATWRYIMGGILGAVLITVAVALYRGDLWGIFSMYVQSTGVYGAEAARRWPLFVEYGKMALFAYWPLLLLTLLACGALWIQKKHQIDGRAIFWLVAAIIPIFEPLLKIGFLYHFSVCLPGLGGFCCCAYARVCAVPKIRVYAALASLLCVCCMLPGMWKHVRKLPVTLEVLATFPAPSWPEKYADASSTIELAGIINRLTRPGDVIAANGFTYFLYPVSGHLPAFMGLADLSRTWINAQANSDKFLQVLEEGNPELIILAKVKEDHAATFTNELEKIIAMSGKYAPVAVLPAGTHANYGWLEYVLMKRLPDGKDYHPGGQNG